MATSIRCSGATSRPMTGSHSSGFSAASRNCRSTFPNFASTSSNGRLSLAILSFRTRRKAAITRSPTPAGRKRPGRSSRASIPPEPTAAPLNARTLAKPAPERLPLSLRLRQGRDDGCRGGRSLRRLLKPLGDPELDQRLAGYTQPAGFTVERFDDPSREVDVDAFELKVRAARPIPVDIAGNVCARVEFLVEITRFHRL